MNLYQARIEEGASYVACIGVCRHTLEVKVADTLGLSADILSAYLYRDLTWILFEPGFYYIRCTVLVRCTVLGIMYTYQ